MAPLRRRRASRRRLPGWITRRRVILSILAAAVLGTGTYGWMVLSSLGHIFHQNPLSVLHDAIAGTSDSNVGRAAQNGQRINIALYGYGGGGHDGAYLSDSIMVVSIQPHAGAAPQVAEISIPRDWYVPLDLGNGHTYDARINEAYSDGSTNDYPNRADVYKGDLGGGALADATLERLLGIHIDYFVGIDFHAFQYAVDAVGGVDVVVPHTFTDYQYPHGECDQGDCGFMTVHFDAGPQHLDGARALIFARSRHSSDPGEGNDFARSKRQQLVLQAVKQKLAGVGGFTRVPAVLSALGDHVRTNLDTSNAKALYELVKDVDPAGIEHLSIDDGNFLYECGYPSNCGAAYLFTHDTTFASLAHYVSNAIPDRAALAEHAVVSVVDASGTGDGASTRWAALLGEIGFHAGDGGSAAAAPITQVIDSSGGRNTRTAQWLATFYGVSVTTVAPASPAAADAAGVTVVLGRDEERAFDNQTGSQFQSGSGTGDGGYQRPSSSAATATPAPARSATPPPTEAPTPPPATPTPLLPPPTGLPGGPPGSSPEPTPQPSSRGTPTPQPATASP